MLSQPEDYMKTAGKSEQREQEWPQNGGANNETIRQTDGGDIEAEDELKNTSPEGTACQHQ